ncbi:CHAT domain-containing protein [Candidatus Venteria ishoeyi]|uniref:CHAT domain-containing protein n=1 Tax=Candidatus Venteria ishoeyi TaxID=1899563 RepID=UPI0025A62173|nr:CHAT domain-containing protein [Candidatus Venteria ishoeyi]MDM8545421.1 CHAT domain-containing protein [Candidatus Venteria ishoeyi]
MNDKQLLEQIPVAVKYPADTSLEDWLESVQNFAGELLQSIATTPEPESAEQKVLLLFLYRLAGDVAEDNFQNIDSALDLYKSGRQQATAFLAAGETSAGVREQTLKLFVNTGITLGQLGRTAEKLETYRDGLKQATAFLAAGETSAGVREQTLKLFVNAGLTLGQLGRTAEKLETYRDGLKQATAFLAAGETSAKVREQTLGLFFNAGFTLGQLGRTAQALETYRDGLAQAKTFLAAGETSAGVREQMLKLFIGAGFTLGQLGRTAQALETYRDGLAQAKTFLAAGETSAGVHEQVLKLLEHDTGTLHNTGLYAAATAKLPELGLWSWALAGQISADDWPILQKNWHIHLETTPNPAHFSFSLQSSLQKRLLSWHDPQKNGLHFKFLPVSKLLRLSRALYVLSQGQAQATLRGVYANLEKTLNHPDLHQLELLSQQQQKISEQITRLQQVYPNLSGKRWSCLSHPLACWSLTQGLNQQVQITRKQQVLLENWQNSRETRSASSALSDWLMRHIMENLDLPVAGIGNLPGVMLGLCLVGDCRLRHIEAPECLQDWQQNPPWTDATRLQALFTAAGWWEVTEDPENPHPILNLWIRTLPELEVDSLLDDESQPNLQQAISALKNGEEQHVSADLALAWENLLKQAKPLARILTALSHKDYQSLLFDSAEPEPWLKDYQSLLFEPAKPKPCLQEHEFQALLALVQGKTKKLIQQASHDFLQQVGDAHSPAGLNARFERLLALLSPPHAGALEGAIQGWTQTVISQQCGETDTAALWQTLEHSRAGLHGLHVKLPPDWAETTGTALWGSLKHSFSYIESAQQQGISLGDRMWPPLDVWLQQVEKYLPPLPDISACQKHLQQQGEVLAQPFFDSGSQQLKVLWLDGQGLSLRELPEICAAQQGWDDLCKLWADNWASADKDKTDHSNEDNPALQEQCWDEVMDSPQVTGFAKALASWLAVAQAEHLRVILPAPLGQLAWEALLPLENKMLRSVSLSHWWQQQQAKRQTTAKQDRQQDWVLSTGHLHEAKEMRLSCALPEALWVAKQWQSTAELPQQALPAATFLRQLRRSRWVHITAHGAYTPEHPADSGLSLGSGKQGHQWIPMWACAALSLSGVELLILSACESNLYGQQSQGLSAPAGLGPGFAAAGVQAVLGTLWSITDLTGLVFAYGWLQLKQQQPDWSLSRITYAAQQWMRQMSKAEFKVLLEDLASCEQKTNDLPADVAEPIERIQRCCLKADDHLLQTGDKPPFAHPLYWAGFHVIN